VALLLSAWALRLPPALQNRFHPDEALYGYWGLLIAHGRDPALIDVPVYKPPLLPYLVAGAQALFGDAEFIVRLPGLAAGLLMIPLTARLVHHLYRDEGWALSAALVVALSPFGILFSATAFPDPVMVALGLAACGLAAGGWGGWAGGWAGLAFAAKQTGLVWVPLALCFLLGRPRPLGRVAAFTAGFAAVVGATFLWDAWRVSHGAISFWSQGVVGYGGLRLIWPQELSGRLRGWLDLTRYLFVSPVLYGLLLVGLPLLLGDGLLRSPGTRRSWNDLILFSFGLLYLLLHGLGAFPVWDRYLLPLMPVLAVLLVRCVTRVLHWVPRVRRVRPAGMCALVVALLLARPAVRAAASEYPIGGDYGTYDGIERVTDFLRRAPEGSVVYQHWLGWHYAYHLFDAPVYLSYWPTPAWLARDVRAFGARELRYITFPAWESSARVERALREVGYELEPVLTTYRRDGSPSFFVHRIRPREDP
jgi:4-amino-4-deoxy-L-arabinose transferase-like glycosyltransferase